MTAKKISLWVVIGVAVAGVSLLLPHPCRACSVVGNGQHTLDPAEQAVDQQPPGQVSELEIGHIKRGRGPSGNGCSASTCDDIGSLAVKVTPPLDDRTGPDQLGYRIEIVGDAPVSAPATDVRATSGVIYLYWDDGAEDDQEAFDFTFTVSAVDLAGNVGSQSEPLRITDPGSGGCGLFPPGPLWLFLVALGLARRHRRMSQYPA